MRICEIIEKFPKLSGLTGLSAKNLCVKNEKGVAGLAQLNTEDDIIGNLIKPKDVIIFELEFSEIWLEVEMTLKSQNKNLKIAFELKVSLDYFISHVKDILIKMGIKSWNKYLKNNIKNQEEIDYYLFSNFSLTFGNDEKNSTHKDIELDNFNGTTFILF